MVSPSYEEQLNFAESVVDVLEELSYSDSLVILSLAGQVLEKRSIVSKSVQT